MRVPGIGNILAQRILSFREDRNITPDLFPTITGVRNVPELIKYFDFTPFGHQSQSSAEAKEGEVLRTSEEADTPPPPKLDKALPQEVLPQEKEGEGETSSIIPNAKDPEPTKSVGLKPYPYERYPPPIDQTAPTVMLNSTQSREVKKDISEQPPVDRKSRTQPLNSLDSSLEERGAANSRIDDEEYRRSPCQSQQDRRNESPRRRSEYDRHSSRRDSPRRTDGERQSSRKSKDNRDYDYSDRQSRHDRSSSRNARSDRDSRREHGSHRDRYNYSPSRRSRREDQSTSPSRGKRLSRISASAEG